MTVQHKNILPVDGIHVPYAFIYADATARSSATGFVADDVGKLALQQSDNSLWQLLTITPTWKIIGSTDASTLQGHSASYFSIDGHIHTQAQSHGTPDTDLATTSLHHTIGTGANQASAGNHDHSGTYEPANTNIQSHVSDTTVHHALGTGATDAAAGNHTHSSSIILSDAIPQKLGIESAGDSNLPARDDHVHSSSISYPVTVSTNSETTSAIISNIGSGYALNILHGDATHTTSTNPSVFIYNSQTGSALKVQRSNASATDPVMDIRQPYSGIESADTLNIYNANSVTTSNVLKVQNFGQGYTCYFYSQYSNGKGCRFYAQSNTITDWFDVRGGSKFDGQIKNVQLAGSGNRSVYSDPSGFLTNSSSDRQLKKEIVTISDLLDVTASIKMMRGVYYKWDISNDSVKNFGEQREIGMIAQEVEGVLPELIGTNSNGYKSLDYPKMVAFLIEVGKRQQEKIEELETRLSTLESR